MKTFNTKKEMTEVLSKKKEISKVKAKEMIEDVLAVMEEMIMDETHDGLDLYGLVKFEVKEVPQRIARNPRDGSEVVVEPHNQIKAKISSRLKRAVK